MRAGTTLLLLLLGLLLGAGLYYIKPQELSTPKTAAASQGRKLVKADLTTADSMTLTQPERELLFTRKGASWQVGKPIFDRVDPDRMATLLTALTEAEILEQVSEGQMSPAAWKLSGLEQPEIHLTVRAGTQPLIDCWIGRAGVVEGTTYITKVLPAKAKAESCLIKANLLPTLTLAPEGWRDNMLVNAPSGTISCLVLKSGNTQVELNRSKPKAPWEMVKPMRTRAHTTRVDGLLAALQTLKISSISNEAVGGFIPGANPLQLTIHSAQLAEPVTITLVAPTEKEKTQTQARASHRHGIFTITGKGLERLWAGVNELRDDRLIYTDAENILKLELSGGSTEEVTLQKQGQLWQLHLRNQWEEANDIRVRRLFEQLGELRVLDFASDSASSLEKYGLEQPYLKLRWTEQLKAESKQASASTMSSELQIGLAMGGNVYAKYADRPFVYQIPAMVLDLFPKDTVRWKSLSPLRFSQFSLRRIELAMNMQPAILLDYDPITAEWHAMRAGQDLTGMLDRVKADQLANKLGTLVVTDWVQNRNDAAKALATPAITVGISLLTEAGNMQSPVRQHTLTFSPTQEGKTSAFFYGRLDQSPQFFIISRVELLDLLGHSVFREAATP
jgi:hypothetical protein